jgi:hypothetical protein
MPKLLAFVKGKKLPTPNFIIQGKVQLDKKKPSLKAGLFK